jgi:hypothetical protein
METGEEEETGKEKEVVGVVGSGLTVISWSNQTRIGTNPSLAQGHPVSKTKFSLQNRLKQGSGIHWPNFQKPECPLAKGSKVGVRQQRGSIWHV